MKNPDLNNLSLKELKAEYNIIENSDNHLRKIDIATRILEQEPKNVEAFNNRGVAYFSLNEFQQAITDYDQAIEINPKNAKAFYNRGIAYSDLGEFQQAITDYDQAIQLNPKFAEAFYNRGNAYRKLGEYKKAIKDYDQAIQLNPNYAKAFYNRGIAHRKLGKEEKAIEDFKTASELDPSIFSQEKGKELKKEFKEEVEEVQKDNTKVQGFQEIFAELKTEHEQTEKNWFRGSIGAIISMALFLVCGHNFMDRLPDVTYIFDMDSAPISTNFYITYVFFSIITFTIIRQYTNAKQLRIEASNRLAMAKLFEKTRQTKGELETYKKEFLPKIVDSIVYSTLKNNDNNHGLLVKITNLRGKLKK
jgi:Flp pilus assembly protein TadD